MKRILFAVAAVAATACTPTEFAQWQEWHAQDPAAAEAFAEEWKAARAQPSTNTSVWDRLANCESGGNWSYNGSSGYDGGLQFLPSVWVAYGGREFAAYAYQASREQQIVVAERILDDVGWQAWPTCSRKLGLR